MLPDFRVGRAPLVLGLVVMAVSALAVVQVRSQLEVARSLETQDNTSIAFVIDDLHRANEALALEAQGLTDRRDSLQKGGQSATVALGDEVARLRLAEGLDPARGPGVTVVVDANLTEVDLQDAVNNLRIAGAEVVSVGGRRVITGTPISSSGGVISVDGTAIHSPWQFAAIGDPSTLAAAADEMTRTLKADPRVRSVSYRSESALAISAVLRQRPFVYSVSQ